MDEGAQNVMPDGPMVEEESANTTNTHSWAVVVVKLHPRPRNSSQNTM